MQISLLPVLIIAAGIGWQAQGAEPRELGRVRVTDGVDYHDSAIIGERPGVSFDGQLATYDQPLTRIEYDALFATPNGTYSILDDADVLWHSPNGAQYRVWSRYTDEEYDVVFLRRAPDEQIVTVDGADYVVPNYDRATILRVEQGGVVFDLDYRGTQ